MQLPEGAVLDTDTTETLKAIGELRDAFLMGSEEWWDCIRWYQRALEIERETRAKTQGETYD